MMTVHQFLLTPVLPEIFLLIAGLLLLVLGSFTERDGAGTISMLAALAIAVAIIFVLVGSKEPTLTFGGHFRTDAFSSFLKVVMFAGAAASLLLAPGYLVHERIDRFEYPILALFATLGMGMMVSANSFLGLYMALELHSLALYVLAAFNRDTVRSTEAGLKYFVLGSLASGMLLYGISLVYGFTGTVMFGQLASLFSGEGAHLSNGALVGIVFIVAGLAFKLAAVPFHMWTPDVYEGAPTPATAFIAAAPKLAAMGLLLRVMIEPFGIWAAQWQQIIVFVAIASMLLGAFAAIGQNNFKRLMAYSGIANVGYALIGLAAGTKTGVTGALVFMALYVVMTVGSFACILALRRGGEYVENLSDLAGLAKRQPLIASAITILMFSLAGIPPMAGFFGKFYVFKAAIDAGMTTVAVIGVLSSVVAAYYYLRIVKLVWFDQPGEAMDVTSQPMVSAIAGVSALVLLLAVLALNPLFVSAEAAAGAIFH